MWTGSILFNGRGCVVPGVSGANVSWRELVGDGQNRGRTIRGQVPGCDPSSSSI